MSADRSPLWPGSSHHKPVDVVGLGQCSLDHVCLVDGLPQFTGKDRILDYTRLPGGQVATALLACTRLGLRSAFLGSVGDDDAAERVLAPLRDAGVDVSGVRVIDGVPTQLAVILLDRASGERTVLWYRDARLALRLQDLSRASIERARALHLDGGDPEVGIWASKVAREAGIPVVLDVDTPVPGTAELLAHVDFPIVSHTFAESFFGSADPREAVRGLVGYGARMAVVTLGEIGALGRLGEREIESPAYRVPVADTTGAGDVFHAAFVWALLEGLDAAGCLRSANAAAGMNCRAVGAQGGLPTRAELEAFLASERPAAWRDPILGVPPLAAPPKR
jgi:sugar/nucleoside kinase (ribokinase family)